MKNTTNNTRQSNQNKDFRFQNDTVQFENGLYDRYMEKGNPVFVEQAVSSIKSQDSYNEQNNSWR